MSKQFFYVQLKFTPKTGIDTVPITRQREEVVEVPKNLVQRKKTEVTNENPGREAIALNLAEERLWAHFRPLRNGF
jgi:hypothetical protein